MASDDSLIRIQNMPMIIKMIERDATAVINEKVKSRRFFLGKITNCARSFIFYNFSINSVRKKLGQIVKYTYLTHESQTV
jgi:hypothetical protein